MADELIRGRGAWSLYGKENSTTSYAFKTLATMDGQDPTKSYHHRAVRYGVAGIQARINATGYKHFIYGPIAVTGVLGPRTMWGIKWFQRTNNLVGDGYCGPRTALALFGPLVNWFAGVAVVPAGHLGGMIGHESGFDPGAVSTWYKPVNGPDRGLGQINKNAHPDITDPQAFDPVFAIHYTAQRLAVARATFAGKGTELQRACSIVQHNSPATALAWWRAGAIDTTVDPYNKYLVPVLKRADAWR